MIKTIVSEKIQELDAKALSELLKELKLYRDLTKQLGDRGKAQYFRNLNNEKLLVVEYVSSITQDTAWEQAQEVYKKSFLLDIQKDDVIFIVNDTLKGGIKVYKDDSLVDISFTKIERLIR